MVTTVDNARLPVNIEQNARGGPGFSTTVLTTTAGRERRNQNWARQRMQYDIGYGLQNRADYEAVLSFFYARAGQARGFLFKDWTDFRGIDAPLGVGDGVGTDFQLVRFYADPVTPYVRRITRPRPATVQVRVGGVLRDTFQLLPLGIVRIGGTVPAIGVEVTASFEFDVPVRFDDDVLELTAPTSETASVDSIPLKELME